MKNNMKAPGAGHTNEAFTPEEILENDLKTPGRKLTPEKKIHMKLLNQKAPLEKSLSMPDMQNRLKKRERFMALRQYMRSESERSFDEVQIRKARLQSLGLAYLSPQNKSLAQSFRYMRNKPTIIAFKTPSLENCENRPSTESMSKWIQISSFFLFCNLFGNFCLIVGFSVVSPGVYSQKEAEEGKILRQKGAPVDAPKQNNVNYPVGKPLEVILFV